MNNKERELIRKEIQQSLQRAPQKAQVTLQQSIQLREMYINAKKSGLIEEFKQQRQNIINSFINKPNTNEKNQDKDTMIKALQTRVLQLETELTITKADLIIFQMNHKFAQ